MTPQERLEQKHKEAVLRLQRLETRMVKAIARWMKVRDQVRRYDRIADKALAAAIGGKLGERELDRLIDSPRRKQP